LQQTRQKPDSPDTRIILGVSFFIGLILWVEDEEGRGDETEVFGAMAPNVLNESDCFTSK